MPACIAQGTSGYASFIDNNTNLMCSFHVNLSLCDIAATIRNPVAALTVANFLFFYRYGSLAVAAVSTYYV